ncbi:hypothetical protein A2cp1_4449 [Anaeromyxobacter dehalogenans 2CP-1]|uniref:Uncharacterized protein n=1 Tax=Anaeromyxobacter dehalogenans (strain ATCC BAA-258 / DSM 21875 / 2CP-1) TaxID=455488 RepID=B8JCP6_ANAD2|nr:hypothetical protein A2cp1_4449 [Anaeromyxobacter dehalogenans 2CP-1]
MVAEVDHPAANYAVIRFTDHRGHERLIDFLEKICGVDTADLQRTALRVSALDPELRRQGLQFRVIHPVVCMESRLSNTVEYEKYQGEHGLLQARMSVRCARGFLLDLLSAGHIDAVRKLNERVFRFAKGQVARAAFARFQLDAFTAIVVDDRLPAQFRTVRYPQMRRYLERRRARHHDALP